MDGTPFIPTRTRGVHTDECTAQVTSSIPDATMRDPHLKNQTDCSPDSFGKGNVQGSDLKLSKKAEGLGLPNLRYYFWAAQLKPLTAWLGDLTDTRWLNTEKSPCQQPLSEL